MDGQDGLFTRLSKLRISRYRKAPPVAAAGGQGDREEGEG
jgi:hypothetical protein